MNPFEIMELKKKSFTKKEYVIYELMLTHVDSVIRDSMTTLAETFKVSQPTITRFCQKLGYDGFNEFKFDVYRHQKEVLVHGQDNSTSLLELYSSLIMQIDLALPRQKGLEIAEKITKAKHVYVTGTHKSFLSAKMLQYNLFKLSIPAIPIQADERQELKHVVSKDDLLVVFSTEGDSCKEMLDEYVKSQTIQTMLITMNDKTMYKNKVDTFVWLPNSKNQSHTLYLENQVIFMVFIDLLTSYIAGVLNVSEIEK